MHIAHLFFAGVVAIKKFVELDYMEYSSDALAQAAYVTDAAATVDQSYSETNKDDQTQLRYAADNNIKVGQTFLTGTSGILDSCKFYLNKVGSPTGNIWATLYATTGGAPTGSAVATSAVVDASTIGGSFALQTFTFSTLYNVSTATTYAIVLEGDYTVSSSNHIQVGMDTSSPSYTGGVEYRFDGTSWSAVSTQDLCFYVYLRSLQSYSESTIKTQGSYSLKIEAAITDSLNKTLTHTVSTIDMSGKSKIRYDIRASRTGSNIKLKFRNGIDSYTKLFTSFDGADAATAFTAETGQVATFVGTAQLDTAQKPYGLSSLLLDGDSDNITLPDSANWTFGTGDFTIKARVRFASLDGHGTAEEQFFVSQMLNGTNFWFCGKENHTTYYDRLVFSCIIGGSVVGTFRMTEAAGQAWNPSINTWYEIEFVRSGGQGYIFIDGVSYAGTNTTFADWSDLAADLWIGARNAGGGDNNYYLNGWIKDVTISKGIARHTSNYTPSGVSDVSYIENTHNQIADAFETAIVDLSGVANSGKNAIDQLQIIPVNADAANTFYLDNIRYK